MSAYANRALNSVTLTKVLQNSNISDEELHIGSDLGGHISIDLSSSGLDTDKKGIVIKLNASQTEAAMQLLDSAGATIMNLDSNGVKTAQITELVAGDGVNIDSGIAKDGNFLKDTLFQYNQQNNNPSSDLGQIDRVWNGSSWASAGSGIPTGLVNSFTNPFVDFSALTNFEKFILQKSLVTISFEGDFVLSGAGNTIRFVVGYSLDGGSTWTLGYDSGVLSSPNGTTPMDFTATVAGDQITDDLLVGLMYDYDGGDLPTVDPSNLTATISLS